MTDTIDKAAALLMDGATGEALELLISDDSTEAVRLRAQIRITLNEADSLRAALTDLDQINPWTVDDVLYAAVAHQRLDDLDGAQGAIQRGLEAFPAHPRLLERLVDLMRERGDYKAGLDIIERMPKDWRLLQAVGDLMAEWGRTQPAVRGTAKMAYTSALTAMPRGKWTIPFKARLTLAMMGIMMQEGDYEDVAKGIVGAEMMIPGEPALKFYRGWVTARRGQPEKALDYLRAAFEAASEPVRQQFRDALSADSTCRDLLDAL
jgi:tetratricopeptide (TPR) repeat protein